MTFPSKSKPSMLKVTMVFNMNEHPDAFGKFVKALIDGGFESEPSPATAQASSIESGPGATTLSWTAHSGSLPQGCFHRRCNPQVPSRSQPNPLLRPFSESGCSPSPGSLSSLSEPYYSSSYQPILDIAARNTISCMGLEMRELAKTFEEECLRRGITHGK